MRGPVHWISGAALVLAGGWGSALADEPEVTFPLGPWVRAGRPVVVRVPGAVRVRGGDAPWALPQGDRGDEFVLQTPRADVSLRDLEIDLGTRTVRRPLDVRPLPAGGTLSASFSGDPNVPGRVAVPRTGLPTVADAWLLFDAAEAPPEGIGPSEARALGAALPRDRPPAFEPLVHAPGPAAFRATAESAASAGGLPPDVVRLLVLLAVVQGTLAFLVRGQRPGVRVLWLSAAPIACAAWMAGAARLPGGVRATLSSWADPATGDRLAVLRLDARRDATVSFRVPPGAGTPALLRFDAADRTSEGAEIGRDVRLSIPAGQSRVLAWRVPAGAGGFSRPGPPAPAPGPHTGPGLAAWLASLGTAPAGAAPEPTPASLLFDARGFVPVSAGSIVVTSRK